MLTHLSETDKEMFLKFSEDPEYVKVDEEGKILKKTISAGNGEKPVDGGKVECHYTGWTLDGNQFDSSRDRGTPFEFDLGRHNVITAWDKGVAQMTVNEEAELICHPDVAYGASGSGAAIPGHAVLRFNIQLLGFSWDDQDKPGDDKWAFVDEKKAAGNAAFKAGNTFTAIGLWNRANEVLYDLMEEGDDIPQAAELSAAVMNNIAAAYVRLQKWKLVLETADRVIESDPKNVKALRRQTAAFMKLGKHEEAVKSAEKTLTLDPENKPAATDLRKAQAVVQAAAAKKKAMYGKMFGGVTGFGAKA